MFSTVAFGKLLSQGELGGERQFYHIPNEYVPFNDIAVYLLEAFKRQLFPDADSNHEDPDIVNNYIINSIYFDLLYGYFSSLVFNNEIYKYIPGHFFDQVYYDFAVTNACFNSHLISSIPRGPVNPDPNSSHIYIIAEAPGRYEGDYGANFVGPFGRALWSLLTEFYPDIWNSNYRIYCANACRVLLPPTKENINTWIKFFRPLILEELSIIKPDIIVCVGATALKQFSREAFNRVLYEPEEYEYSIGFANPTKSSVVKTKRAKLYALPLDAFKSHDSYSRFSNSLRKIVSYGLLGEVPRGDNITFTLIRDEKSLSELIDRWLNTPGLVRVSVDVEWHGYYPINRGSYVRCISLASSVDPENTGYIIETSDTSGRPTFIGGFEAVARQLNRLFNPNNNIQIIGHNFTADAIWLESIGVNVLQKYIIPENQSTPDYPGIFDTIIAHHAHDECATFDLEKSAELYVGAIPWSRPLEEFLASYAKTHKLKQKDIGGYGIVPNDILYPYAVRDAVYTLKLFWYHAKALDSDVYRNSSWIPYWNNMRANLGLYEARKCGILVDRERLKLLSSSFIATRERLNNKLRELTGWDDFNYRSSQQCVALLFGERYIKKRVLPAHVQSLNLTPVKTTKGENWGPECEVNGATPSTDAEVCEYLAQFSEVVRILRDIRLLDQVLKTVLPDETGTGGIAGFICADGRIHPQYIPLKETRRCSCRDPNIQNLSKSREEDYVRILGDNYVAPIRSIFVADPDYVLVEVDYSAAELLMLGVCAQDHTLIQDYWRSTLPKDHPDKLDIHSNIAKLAFKLPCPPTKEGLQSIGAEVYRLYAKRIIFGLNYGRGAVSCYNQLKAQGADVTLQDIESIIEAIHARYTKIRDYQERVKARVRNPGFIRNCFGSYRRFYINTSNQEEIAQAEREALNFPCQSGVADAIGLAMFNFYTYPDRKKYGYKLCMNNHDALVFLVPKNTVDEFLGKVVKECMQERVQFRSCDLDGRPVSSEWYYFAYEAEVYNRWNED